MQQNQTLIFACQACGHQFQSAWQVVAQQPTCPRCRTYGRIAAPNGALVGAPAAPVPAPAPVRPRGGPVRRPTPRPAAEGDYVTVAATTAYGGKTTNKALISALVAVGITLGSLVVLYFIVQAVQDRRATQQQERKEIVQDARSFEKAIDESVARVRKLLSADQSREMRETNDFHEVLDLIQASGGQAPLWQDPPRPGKPFKSFGFVVSGKHENTGEPDAGFIMLLYYRTAAEVNAAAAEISSQISGNTRNFSLTANADIWYLAYSASPYGGSLFDTLRQARDMGAPSSFSQFTDRVGGTYKGKHTE